MTRTLQPSALPAVAVRKNGMSITHPPRVPQGQTAHLMRVGAVIYVTLGHGDEVDQFRSPRAALRALGVTPTPLPRALTARGALTIAQALDGVQDDPDDGSALARECGGVWDDDTTAFVFADGSSGRYNNIKSGAMYPNAIWFEACEDDEE